MARSLLSIACGAFGMLSVLAVSSQALAEPSSTTVEQPLYDLARVEGIDRFQGTEEVQRRLAQHGFVVTDEQFRQIFEVYVNAPGPGKTLPLFITTDSAWHTYHVLLEEGMLRLEEELAATLPLFSERLYRQARRRADKGDNRSDRIYRDLALFAAVGGVMQRPEAIEKLQADEQAAVAQTIAAVRQGAVPCRVLFFGLPAMPSHYNASAFYGDSPWLADYFAARQWYATNVFRLRSDDETERAIHLALLVRSDKELVELYEQLTAPFHTLLGPADDASVNQYADTASAAFGKDTSAETIATRLDAFRAASADLPSPQVNDQYLSPEDYAQFGELAKGFRLLPPRRIPSSVLFQQTVDPKVPGRMFPSGIDLFATGPLANDAARTAIGKAEDSPATAEAILAAKPIPLPVSLHGQALDLLTALQQPLPAAAPRALHTPAWKDKQLWTQLGAWAEQRHTWALQTKLSAHCFGMSPKPSGYVSPYPDFFRKLGRLAKETSVVFRRQDKGRSRSARAGQMLLRAAAVMRRLETEPNSATVSDHDHEETLSKIIEWRSYDCLMNSQYDDTAIDPSSGIVLNACIVEELGRRWIAGSALTEQDQKAITALLAPDIDPTDYLDEFATVCDRLAQIARKELDGKQLDDADSTFIEEYGETLARFHFYGGNAYLEPRDDFPVVTPVFASPIGNQDALLYAGVARPETLYVIVEVQGKPVLHRGAVLSYREFQHPIGHPLDDAGWQEQVAQGKAPAPPAFTASFRHAPAEQELLEAIRQGRLPPQVFSLASPAVTTALLEQLIAGRFEDAYYLPSRVLTKATDEHVGLLLAYLEETGRNVRHPERRISEIAQGLERFDLSSHRKELYRLLHFRSAVVVDAAAYLLGRDPDALDVDVLAEHYGCDNTDTRRLTCYLLGRLHRPDAAAAALVEKATRDRSAVVRYQAIVTMLQWHQQGAPIPHPLLTRSVDMTADENPEVGSAAVRLLVVLDQKDTAPQLLRLLQEDLPLRWGKSYPKEKIDLKLLALGSESFPRPNAGVGRRITPVIGDGIGDGNDPFGPFDVLSIGDQFFDPFDEYAVLPLCPLPVELIAALVVFKHQPAVPQLTRMLQRRWDINRMPGDQRFVHGFAAEALDGLLTLQPDRRDALLETTVADESADRTARCRALMHIAAGSNMELVRGCLPLLAVAEPSSATQNRQEPFYGEVALAIAKYLEQAHGEEKDLPTIRTEAIARTERLLKPHASEKAVLALFTMYGPTAVRRMVDFATDRTMPIRVRAEALRHLPAPEADPFGASPDANDLPRRQKPFPELQRLIPMLDDRTAFPNEPDKLFCDDVASALAWTLQLKHSSPERFDRAGLDRFIESVRREASETSPP